MIKSIEKKLKSYFKLYKKVLLIGGVLFVIGVLIGFGVSYLIYNFESDKDKKVIEIESNENEIDPTTNKILVDVRGAIKNPGVYEIEENTIIDNVVKLAGGFTTDADVRRIEQEINFAKTLGDREKLYIPYKNSTPVNVTASKPTGISFTNKVNINRASSSELESLPGIGPSTAQKIIQGRPYKKIQDLLNVKGIGESLLSKIRDKIEI